MSGYCTDNVYMQIKLHVHLNCMCMRSMQATTSIQKCMHCSYRGQRKTKQTMYYSNTGRYCTYVIVMYTHVCRSRPQHPFLIPRIVRRCMPSRTAPLVTC